MWQEWISNLAFAFQAVIPRFGHLVPTLLSVFVILVVGWLAGMLVGWVIDKIFRLAGLQALFTAARLDDLVKKSGVTKDTTQLLAGAAKWLVYLIAFLTAIYTLQIPQVGIFLETVFIYIPSALAAAMILLAGVIVAHFLSKVVKGVILAGGLGHAEVVSAILRYGIIIFAFITALKELGIGLAYLQTIFTGIVAAIAIAGGIALGLGGQGVAKNLVEKIREETKK